MGKLIDYAVTTITILLAILSVVLLVYQPILVGNVSGSSMEPTLSDGDKFVYTSLVEPDVNDIVVFEYDRSKVQNPSESTDRGEVLVVHRIIEKYSEDTYITKGDNNRKADGRILESEIQGVAVLHYDSDTGEFRVLV